MNKLFNINKVFDKIVFFSMLFTSLFIANKEVYSGNLYLKTFNYSNLTIVSDKKNHHHSLKFEHITIIGPYVNASIGKSPTTAAYMKILSSKDDKIIKLFSPLAKKIEIHTSLVNKAGLVKMKKLNDLIIKKNKPLILESGGHHIMVMGLKSPLMQGDTFPLKIYLESGIEINLNLDSVNSLRKKQHSHH
tara:strand:+ start:90 stop:659 length:570 start_codon:yes stop_codon:yes gene_type:complete